MNRRHLVMLATAAFAMPILGTARAGELRVPGDFPTIQAAIDASVDGDEVVIADGVYTGDGNRDIDFLGKAITVRSENGPENCIIDCEGSRENRRRAFWFHRGESFTSVLDGVTIINGVAPITEQWPNGGAIWISGASPTIVDCRISQCLAGARGGGIWLGSGSPEIRGCRFVDNYSATSNGNGGGGLYSEGSPRVIDCLFERNGAISFGGGIFSEGPMITIEGCSFDRNEAPFEGGGGVATRNAVITNCSFVGAGSTRYGNGVLHRSGDLVIRDCFFTHTQADFGGGLASLGRKVTAANCQFFDDNDASHGAAAYFRGTGTYSLTNCTFWNNESAAEEGGGALYVWSGEVFVTNSTFNRNHNRPPGVYAGVYAHELGHATLTNCILWNNTLLEVGGNVDISHSIIRGGWPGEGNIDADPLFVDAEIGDLRLLPGSPAIDSGNNLGVPADEFDLDEDGDTEEPVPFDLEGFARFVDDPDTDDTGRCGDPCELPIVDMGAYEFGAPGVCCMADRDCVRNPPWRCDGDVDGDGQVNPVDSGLVQAVFGSSDEQDLCNYDLDCDGQINPVDSGIVQSLFGTCALVRPPCDDPQCVEVTVGECHERGGSYLGRSSSCPEDACGTASGACCLDVECAGTSRRADCLTSGGRWYIFEDCDAGFECPELSECSWDNGVTPNGFNGRALSPPNFPDIRVVDDVITERPGCAVQRFHASVTEDDGWISGDVITIYVYDDAEGRPKGGRPHSSVTTGFIRTATGDTYFGNAVYDYRVEAVGLDLPPGRSWIGFRNPQASGSGTDYWLTSDGGPDGTGSSTGYLSLNAGATWIASGERWHHVFELVP